MSQQLKKQLQRARRSARRSRGFSLIEIMAVVVIMALLMSLVGTAVFGQLDKARIETTRTQIKQIESALAFYHMDNGHFPTSEQGLQALINPPTTGRAPRTYRPGGYLQGKKLPADAWGEQFLYESPGSENPESYDIWSYGADGQPGGEGTDQDIIRE